RPPRRRAVWAAATLPLVIGLLGAPAGLGASPSPRAPGPDPDVLTSAGTMAEPLADDTSAGTGPASPEPEGPRWPLFADAENKVGSGMLAVDAQDGIHVAYAHQVPVAEHPRAAYAYCPASAACGAGEGWIGVELGQDVLGVMLATTRDGHPRLLIQQDGQVYPGGRDYSYAACDEACDRPESWSIGYV